MRRSGDDHGPVGAGVVEVVRRRHNDDGNAPAESFKRDCKDTFAMHSGADAAYVGEAEDIAQQRFDEFDGRRSEGVAAGE